MRKAKTQEEKKQENKVKKYRKKGVIKIKTKFMKQKTNIKQNQ